MPEIIKMILNYRLQSWSKNNETNDKFYRKVAFPRYTESVKFMSQSRGTASKLKPHRGLGTRLPSPS